MRRLLLPAAMLAVALPAATAHAAVVPAVSGGTLTVTGDGAADTITVRAPSPTTLDVNGATFDRSTFSRLAIRSGGGDDTIRIADALTETVTIEAGDGADGVTGGPGAETIVAGAGTDLVQPGAGDDDVHLGAGDDTLVQGDGLDRADGEAGRDRLQAAGTGEQDEITAQADGALVRVARDTGPATTEGRGFEALDVVAGGGADLVDVGDLGPTEVQEVDADLGVLDGAADRIDVQGSAGADLVDVLPSGDDAFVLGLDATLRIHDARAGEDRLTLLGGDGRDQLHAGSAGERIGVTLDGGAGDDDLRGSAAADELRGGAGNDVADGDRGDDVIDLGDGDDGLVRTAGDGRDRVEGGAGTDRLDALGSGSDDAIEVGRLLSTTRVASGFTDRADLRGVETVAVNPMTGTDKVTVQDLGGTATRTVDVHLSVPDARVDTLAVGGTQGDDDIKATTSGTTETVSGLAATVNLAQPERGEKLVLDGGNGDDTIDATGLVRDRLQPELRGSAGVDTLIGSPGQDVIDGGIGNDVALLGGGLDTFTWGPGEGHDIVEGGAGTDFLQMDGSGAAERFDVVPVGQRTRVTRDVENVVLDLGDMERLDLLPGTGADTVHVADMSGTDTDHVDVNLARARGTVATDQANDTVLVDGTFGADAITATAGGSDVRLTGLAAITTTRFSDPALDHLHVDTKPGNDSVTVEPGVQQRLGFSFTQ